MNNKILNKEVQHFLSSNQDEVASAIALKKSPFDKVSSMDLAQQIEGKQRCQKKLPLWSNTPGIYFPPRLHIEQSSSESTASYKSTLIGDGPLLDMTGGFGVDTYYFSKVASLVIHCERSRELSSIARHNLKTLGASEVVFEIQDSIDYLKQTDLAFDTIYADPSRRVNTQKVFMLKDTEPDIISNLSLILSKCRRLIIKTSPLYDISLGLKELSNVEQIHVLSVQNDCKELLWVISQKSDAGCRMYASALNNCEIQTVQLNPLLEKQQPAPELSEPLSYIYEPDVALMKTGCFKQIAIQYKLLKLHTSTHLYTSDQQLAQFTGRIFTNKKTMSYKLFCKLKKHGKFNVISRNFPFTVAQLRLRHKIQEGGTAYLIFCKDNSDNHVVIEAERLK